MSTWLVTGGAGYIGAHVVRRLREAGIDVVVLDNLATGLRSFVPDDVPFVGASIGDRDAVLGALRDHDIDGIVHLAALKFPGVSVEEPLVYYRENVEGMRTLLDAAVEAGVERFVYSSSCSVYGTPADDTVVESTEIGPESPYGETKLIGEWLLAAVARSNGVRHTSLRYFNVVGSGYEELFDSSPHNLFPKVFRALDAGERPKVFGTDYPTPDGSCIRDYVHVGDLADAHVIAARRLDAGDDVGPLYNIGTGAGASVLEVLAAMGRVLGRAIDVERIERRPGDPARIIADGSLIERELGWRPRHDLDAMVESAWRAWRASSPS